MCRVPATGSLPVLRVACSLAPWPAARMLPSFSFSLSTTSTRAGCCSAWPPGRSRSFPTPRRFLFWGLWRAFKRSLRVSDFPAAPAAQRSTHGHGDGLEAWWMHADTGHSAHRPRIHRRGTRRRWNRTRRIPLRTPGTSARMRYAATWPLLEEPDWAAWADSTRFETTACLLQGYATAEVDAFQEAIRDTFLGGRQ